MQLLAPVHILLDLIFPRGCAVCDAVLEPGQDHWCNKCGPDVLAATAGEYCPRCGLPVGPYMANANGCNACRDKRWALEGVARVGPYRSVIGRLVRRFKFDRQQRLDAILGEMLSAAIGRWEWVDELDAIVPVPITWRSRLHYSGSPVALLAAQAGQRLGVPVVPALRLGRKKRRQTGLPLAERAANVRGIFTPARIDKVEGKTLCIIDDVSTSGSTLHEAARAMKRAGAAAVYGAVVARTEPSSWADI